MTALRSILIVLFAAWIPLACCCRAIAGAAEPTATVGSATAGDHACCKSEKPNEEAPPADAPDGHCDCSGHDRTLPDAQASTVTFQIPPALELAWPDLFVSSIDTGTTFATRPGISRPQPEAAPTLRALHVLLTV